MNVLNYFTSNNDSIINCIYVTAKLELLLLYLKIVAPHQLCNVTQERNNRKSTIKQNCDSRFEHLCIQVFTIQLLKSSLIFLMCLHIVYFKKKARNLFQRNIVSNVILKVTF